MAFAVRVAVSVDQQFISDLRERVPAIRNRVRAALKDEIAPHVEEELVKRTVAMPDEAQHPFAFSPKGNSLGTYFWLLRNNQLPGQTYDPADGAYQRTGNLADGWHTDVNVQANEYFLSATNDATGGKDNGYFSQAVFGPDAVEGHDDTGWGSYLDDQLEDLSLEAEGMLLDAVDDALAHYESLA